MVIHLVRARQCMHGSELTISTGSYSDADIRCNSNVGEEASGIGRKLARTVVSCAAGESTAGPA